MTKPRRELESMMAVFVKTYVTPISKGAQVNATVINARGPCRVAVRIRSVASRRERMLAHLRDMDALGKQWMAEAPLSTMMHVDPAKVGMDEKGVIVLPVNLPALEATLK